MKKLLLILIPAFVLFSFITEKTYKVELPLERWVKHSKGLTHIQNQLNNSDLPSKQVRFMIDSILTPIQIDMLQVNKQLSKDTANGKK